MPGVLAFLGKLAVDALGDVLDIIDCLGDLAVLKLGDVPKQQPHLRVNGHAPRGGRVLEHHLLLHERAGKHRMDHVGVELRIAGVRAHEAILHVLQALLLLLGERGIGLLLRLIVEQ